MADDRTKDEIEFGPERWVYCKSHLRPHGTGWCTVSPRDKILLEARDQDSAYAETRKLGLEIYGETK